MILAAIDPASKVARTFTNQDELASAMQNQGYIPIHSDGSLFDVKYLEAEGGFLIDGAPLNVYFDGVWFQGQKEVLQPYLDAGSVQQPAAEIWNLPTVPMPPAIVEQYVQFKERTGQSVSPAVVGGGMNIPLIGVGLLVAALFLFGGGKQTARRNPDYDDDL